MKEGARNGKTHRELLLPSLFFQLAVFGFLSATTRLTLAAVTGSFSAAAGSCFERKALKKLTVHDLLGTRQQTDTVQGGAGELCSDRRRIRSLKGLFVTI